MSQYDLVTREQRHLSVVAHRDGGRTVNLYRDDDPDSCARSLRLTAPEVASLIDALSPSHHSSSLLSTTPLGLVAERVEVAGGSRWNGRVLGETRMRTETGASVVAVLRKAEAILSPTRGRPAVLTGAGALAAGSLPSVSASWGGRGRRGVHGGRPACPPPWPGEATADPPPQPTR